MAWGINMIKEERRKEALVVYDSISGILKQSGEGEVHPPDLADAIDHGILVRKIAVLLCRQMGVSWQDYSTICEAACVHDIGKLKMGQHLYGRNKEALHIEELRYMRMHAQIGYEMLKKCGYPDSILETVYHHHENYDGSGYPGNLQGKRIPFCARVLKVCDVFAALISERPYRSAFDMETAMEMMIENIKEYDLGVFLEFMKIYHSPEFVEIEEYAKVMNRQKRYFY